jgi:hypothetical protein
VGRFSFRLPRPYESHDPRHGRPGSWFPEFTAMVAGSWLIASVWSDLTIASWSTIFAVQGKSSLTQAPLWPARWNLKRLGARGKLFWPEVMVVRRWFRRTESGSSLPNIRPSFGL